MLCPRSFDSCLTFLVCYSWVLGSQGCDWDVGKLFKYIVPIGYTLLKTRTRSPGLLEQWKSPRTKRWEEEPDARPHCSQQGWNWGPSVLRLDRGWDGHGNIFQATNGILTVLASPTFSTVYGWEMLSRKTQIIRVASIYDWNMSKLGNVMCDHAQVKLD